MRSKTGTKPSRKTTKKRAYDSTRRQEQAAATREDIVNAAAALVKEGVRLENLSFATVAERARVAVRTVYRHFDEPSDLLHAVATKTLQSLGLEAGESDASKLAVQLQRFHHALAQDPSLYRLFVAAPIRSEIRIEEMLRSMLQPALAKIPERVHRQIVAAVELFASPFAWEVLHSSYGLSTEVVTRTCLAAMQALIDGATRAPEVFEPRGPLPPHFK